MEEKKIKPQLHQSHLSVLYRCGHKFAQIYLLGKREPSTTPLLIGTATHAGIAFNLNNKIDKGTLLPREAVQDLTRDEFRKAWEESPVVLNEEEVSDGLKKTKDTCQDIAIELALVHHYAIAPKIYPKHVERKWVLEAKGYPYDMAGTMDVDEEFDFDREKGIYLPKPYIRIRDNKTKAKNVGQREVDMSEQYSFYAFAKYMMDHVLPDKVVQDNLIKPTKRRPAFAVSYESTRTIDDFEVVKRRFTQACSVIEKGAFTPACPSDWWCSKEFCGFAAVGDCPYFNSKRSLTITKPEQKGGNHGQHQAGANDASAVIADLEGCLESQ